jgi:DNA-binding CsgD family transcriptional regulator
MGRLEREIPNLRAAVDYCLMTPSQAESALRLAVSLPSMFWLLNGQLGEARRWLAPAREPGLPSPERAAALVIGSYLAFAQGDLQEGASMLVDGSTMAERLADPAAQVLAAHFRSVGRFFADSVEEGVDDLRSALELLDSLPLETELDLHVLLLSDLLVTCSISGEFELGLRCRERVLAATASFPDSFDRGYGIWAAAMLDERIGELDRAADEIAEAVRIKLIWLGSDAVGLAIVIEEAAVIAGRRSEHTLAATILGFADVFWTTLDADRNAHHHLQRLHVACERAAREALGDAAFLRAYDQGRAMSPAQIGALLAGRPAPAAPQPGPSLTAREQETAALLAAGLTNREIAARLFISTRTAEGHVQRLMAKLGVTRREDVARALGRPE